VLFRSRHGSPGPKARIPAMPKDPAEPQTLFGEYVNALARHWWWLVAMVAFSGGYDVVEYLAGLGGYTLTLPRWVGLALGLAALMVAQFLAFRQMRKERDDARAFLAATNTPPDVWLEGTFPGVFTLHAHGHACEIRTGPLVIESAVIIRTHPNGEEERSLTQRCTVEFPVVSDLRDGDKVIEPSLSYSDPRVAHSRSDWPESGPAAAMKEFFRAAALVRNRENVQPDFSALSVEEIDALVERRRQPYHFNFDITFWNADRTQQWTRHEVLVYEPERDAAFVRHNASPVGSLSPFVEIGRAHV
jgi:hypothetical protein